LPWGVTIDGTSILKDEGWREVKLGAVFHFWEVSGEVKAREKSYRAGLWKAEEMGEALSLETRRRGIDTIYEDVFCCFWGDGAAWIWNLAQTHYPYATQIVDWYHAEERLWGVGRAMYGQGKERTRGWVEARLEELRIGDVEGVILGLMELKPKREEVKEEVEQALSLFYKSRDEDALPHLS